MDKITVGIPTYNSSKYLEESLSSILNQTYENIEFIISDNASTDNTKSIISEFQKKHHNLIVYHQEKNAGPISNFKFLLEKSSPESTFFMWAASDDLWSKDFVKNIISQMINEKTGIGFSPYIYIDENGKSSSSMRSFNFSSRFTLLRIFKFLYYFDDGFFYGIYRKELINQIEFPIWPGRLQKFLLNIAYPFLIEALLKSNFSYSINSTWYNRMHHSKQYVMSSEQRIINILIRGCCYLNCIKRINRKNILITMLLFPYITAKYVKFICIEIKDYIKVTTRAF